MSTSNLLPAQAFDRKTAKPARFGSNFLSNTPIAWKIGLIVLILSLSTLSVGGIAGVGLGTMRYYLGNIYDFMLVPIVAISNADRAMADDQFEFQKLHTEKMTSAELAQSIDVIQKNDVVIAGVISQYKNVWITTKSPGFTAILQNTGNIDWQNKEVATFDNALEPSFVQYKASRDAFFKNIQNGQVDEQVAHDSIQKLQDARQNLLTLIDINNHFADISNQAATAAYTQTMISAGVVLLTTLLLALVVSYLILSSITARMRGLIGNAFALQEGDFNQSATVTGRDEIGLLGSIFGKMGAQLKDLFDALEHRVGERTHDLELASEVGRAITEKVGNLSEMLAEAAELIRSRFDLYYTQVYLADPAGRTLVLQAGTGEAGRQLLERGHRLPVSPSSLNGRAVSERRHVLVDDTEKSGSFLPNPLLPLTRSELSIPLIVNNKVVGVLDMQSDKPETFTEANLPAFQVLAGQLAIAVQNAALFDQVNQARLDVEAQARSLTTTGWQDFLNGVERSDSIGYVFNQKEILPVAESQNLAYENTFSVPIQITGANVGEIQLGDDVNREWSATERQIVRSTVARVAQHLQNLRLLAQAESYRIEAEQLSRRLTREGWNEYLRERQELAAGYVYDQNQVRPLYGKKEVVSKRALSYPLVVRSENIGEVIINTENKEDANTKEFVSTVVQQLSDHIENLRLLEEAEQQRLEAEGLTHELETVAAVSSTTSTVLNPERLLNSVVDLTKESFGLYHTHIYLVDKDTNAIVLAAGAGEVGRRMVAQGHSISGDQEHSLVARAAREKQAVIVNDVRKESDFLPNPLLPETRSEMAVPMIVGSEVLGVFDVQANIANRFTEKDVRIQTTLAAQVAVALQNARLYVEQSATVTKLRELDRLKSSFLANMSHELRTPLNSILGFADVMLEELDGPLTENMANDLGLIQKNGQHLLHLINDVLDMAKIESGRMNLNLEKFEVRQILEEVTSITSPLASEKNLALFIKPDSDPEVEIFADHTRIRQVMINLINNAIKFTEKGKISICVTRQAEEKVLITVADTGMGIPPDKLESVFEEFIQVDISSTRKVGGTGLGLPISRKLVEMHGGRLWAESTGINGEGSVFYVELPLEAVVAEDQGK